MKAPELPTKIYFSILDMGSGYVYNPSLDDNGGTEYIRKDALISFLEKERDDLYNWHFHDEDRKFKVYEEVIDKIKEL